MIDIQSTNLPRFLEHVHVPKNLLLGEKMSILLTASHSWPLGRGSTRDPPSFTVWSGGTQEQQLLVWSRVIAMPWRRRFLPIRGSPPNILVWDVVSTPAKVHLHGAFPFSVFFCCGLSNGLLLWLASYDVLHCSVIGEGEGVFIRIKK